MCLNLGVNLAPAPGDFNSYVSFLHSPPGLNALCCIKEQRGDQRVFTPGGKIKTLASEVAPPDRQS
jgi:hypothetical protein